MTNSNKIEHKIHIIPLRIYLGVAAALLVLTGITVGVSFLHFGAFNLVIAMLIAAVKGTLVILFFMHLLYDNKFYLAIFSFSLVFLAVFIILTMFDTMNRGEIYKIKDGPIQKNAQIYETDR
ncbi:MAG: cytochrome C oxidase subunit IV family protein [Calditrichaceae bacterium]